MRQNVPLVTKAACHYYVYASRVQAGLLEVRVHEQPVSAGSWHGDHGSEGAAGWWLRVGQDAASAAVHKHCMFTCVLYESSSSSHMWWLYVASHTFYAWVCVEEGLYCYGGWSSLIPARHAPLLSFSGLVVL